MPSLRSASGFTLLVSCFTPGILGFQVELEDFLSHSFGLSPLQTMPLALHCWFRRCSAVRLNQKRKFHRHSPNEGVGGADEVS